VTSLLSTCLALGYFLRDFVSSKFEIWRNLRNSLRRPDRTKFVSWCNFAIYRLCTLSDLLSQQLATTTTTVQQRRRQRQYQRRATRPKRGHLRLVACSSSKADHSGIRPAKGSASRWYCGAGGLGIRCCYLAFFLCLLCLRPSTPPHFGCIWLPLAFRPISPHQTISKRNFARYPDGRRKKQPRARDISRC
jgi:hypothetical protein